MVDPSKDSVAEPKPSPAIPQNPEPSRDLESGRPSTLIDRDDEKAQTDIMPNPAPPILTTAQDWTGPDDPENPMNWPLAQRIYHTTIPALFNFIVTFSSGVYAPGVDAIAKRFDVSATVSLLGLSLYVLGLGFGPILAAPLSETFGRRVVYLVSLPISSLFILGAGLAQNFATLAICRFLAGFFGAPTLAVGAGTNADLWPPVVRAVPSSK